MKIKRYTRLGRVRRIGIAMAGATLLLSLGCARPQETAGSKALAPTLPRIDANRNLSPAGQLRNGILTVHLDGDEAQVLARVRKALGL